MSKTASIVSKMPRSYIILLKILEKYFLTHNTCLVEQSALLNEYNRQAVSLMIDRIQSKGLDELLEGLANSSIISRKDIKKGKGKHVKLDIELDELTEALDLL